MIIYDLIIQFNCFNYLFIVTTVVSRQFSKSSPTPVLICIYVFGYRFRQLWWSRDFFLTLLRPRGVCVIGFWGLCIFALSTSQRALALCLLLRAAVCVVRVLSLGFGWVLDMVGKHGWLVGVLFRRVGFSNFIFIFFSKKSGRARIFFRAQAKTK